MLKKIDINLTEFKSLSFEDLENSYANSYDPIFLPSTFINNLDNILGNDDITLISCIDILQIQNGFIIAPAIANEEKEYVDYLTRYFDFRKDVEWLELQKNKYQSYLNVLLKVEKRNLSEEETIMQMKVLEYVVTIEDKNVDLNKYYGEILKIYISNTIQSLEYVINEIKNENTTLNKLESFVYDEAFYCINCENQSKLHQVKLIEKSELVSSYTIELGRLSKPHKSAQTSLFLQCSCCNEDEEVTHLFKIQSNYLKPVK